MKVRPAYSLTVPMSLHKDNGTTPRVPKTDDEQISTYLEALNLLVKGYATESNIAKRTSDIASFKKRLQWRLQKSLLMSFDQKSYAVKRVPL